MTSAEQASIDRVVAIWDSAPGRSGIFNFPFRIYTKGALTPVEMSSTSHRYRVTFIENNASTKRREVPVEVWPNFKSHPSFLTPVSNQSPVIDLTYDNEYYSQLRLDVWGPKSEEEVSAFCTKLLDILRVYSDQYWINSYEWNFSTTSMSASFPIDESGLCLEYPRFGQRIMGHAGFKPITNELLADALQNAVAGAEVQSCWIFYFDAMNTMVKEQLDQAVMLLVLSLELGRNIAFRKFVAIKKETLSGVTFESPFDDTDLIKNLGVNLKKATGISLEEQLPEDWECINKMYVARHQVAHGKKAAFLEGGKMRLVDTGIFLRWARAARNTLIWLYNLDIEMKR